MQHSLSTRCIFSAFSRAEMSLITSSWLGLQADHGQMLIHSF
jgi:hypothetical protein